MPRTRARTKTIAVSCLAVELAGCAGRCSPTGFRPPTRARPEIPRVRRPAAEVVRGRMEAREVLGRQETRRFALAPRWAGGNRVRPPPCVAQLVRVSRGVSLGVGMQGARAYGVGIDGVRMSVKAPRPACAGLGSGTDSKTASVKRRSGWRAPAWSCGAMSRVRRRGEHRARPSVAQEEACLKKACLKKACLRKACLRRTRPCRRPPRSTCPSR